GDLRRGKERFSAENRSRVQSLLDSFAPILEAHACTVGQLVIAWTVRQHGVTHALVGARTREQAIENAAAGRIELTDAEVGSMNHAVSAALPGIV
ncbi:MAG: aldo/keto reductase, partial [Planctomycetota bacterium]